MNKKIAILRGINVGGKRKIIMAELKSLCENLGLSHVVSYIQSGNLVFETEKESTDIEYRLEKAIQDKFGFAVPVIVRAAADFRALVDENPFYSTEADINQLHVTFLKSKPKQDAVAVLQTHTAEPDKFELAGAEVFIFCAGKYHQSKLSNHFFEKNLAVGATTRNWKTVMKLVVLAEE